MLSWYLLPGIVSSLSDTQDFYQKCGNTSEYGCFVDPVGCETTNNCTLGAVWRGTTIDVYEFESETLEMLFCCFILPFVTFVAFVIMYLGENVCVLLCGTK